MNETKEESLKMITNLINAANNLMIAVLAEDENDISHWNKSLETWRVYINRKIKRYLKTFKEKVPF